MLDILQKDLAHAVSDDKTAGISASPAGLSSYEAKERLIIDGKNVAVKKKKARG